MASSVNPVLIGTLQKEIVCSKKVLHWDVNKIGGELNLQFDGRNINMEDIICSICKKKLALVSQIYCPLGNSLYDRVLVICCCINPKCWNKSSSWTVLRFQRKELSSNQASSTPNPTQWLADESMWGENNDAMNDLDTELSSAVENIALQQASPKIEEKCEKCEDDEIMNEANPNVIPESFDCPKNTPDFLCDLPKEEIGSDETPVFKPYYIEVCEEPEGSIDEDDHDHAKELLSEYEKHNGNPFNNVKSDTKMEQESYEKETPIHGDSSFYKFYKRISRLPSQIIRYCWNGEPLFISDATDELKMLSKCQYCGAGKVFELQLLPALVEGLKLNNNDYQGHPVEFGTAVVFTCEKSCWDERDNYRLESIIVQPDPDEKYFQMA